jgi:hypothetical protein
MAKAEGQSAPPTIPCTEARWATGNALTQSAGCMTAANPLMRRSRGRWEKPRGRLKREVLKLKAKRCSATEQLG